MARYSSDGVLRYAFENAFDDSESDASDEEDIDPGLMFAEMLKKIHLKGGLPATSVCLLAHWGKLAGLQSPACDWAKPPGLQSGKYSDHLKRCLNLDPDASDLYELDMPGNSRHDGCRDDVQVLCMLPHEALAREVEANPAILDRARAQHEGQSWWNTLQSSPLADNLARGEPVLPISLYLDGVKYINSDSV